MSEKAKVFLTDRSRAYNQVFAKDSPAVKAVLADIEKFCRANESTFHPDARVAAQLDGRREVFLRIMDHLTLSGDQLWEKYGNKKSKIDE